RIVVAKAVDGGVGLGGFERLRDGAGQRGDGELDFLVMRDLLLGRCSGGAHWWFRKTGCDGLSVESGGKDGKRQALPVSVSGEWIGFFSVARGIIIKVY